MMGEALKPVEEERVNGASEKNFDAATSFGIRMHSVLKSVNDVAASLFSEESFVPAGVK